MNSTLKFLLMFGLSAISAAAQASPVSVDYIAQKLIEAEAKAADLKVTYQVTQTSYDESNSPAEKLIIDVVYAYKNNPNLSGRCRYVDYNVYSVDPNTSEKTLKYSGFASFNGSRTILLDRKPKQGDLMEGVVLSGYDPNYFEHPFHTIVHNWIWCIGSRLTGVLIQENKDTFHIEDTSELINGLPVIRLSGCLSSSGLIRSRLWVCPDKDYLPLKMQIMAKDRGVIQERALYDLVQLGNGMWYPRKILFPDKQSGISNLRLSINYDISDISVNAIPDEFFAPQFPPNTHVIDNVERTSYTTY